MGQASRETDIDELPPLPDWLAGVERRGPADHFFACVERASGRTFAEFGVGRGGTARLILQAMSGEARLHLFDSWRGLLEPWDRGCGRVSPIGSFRHAPPDLGDHRVELHGGLFSETVARWANLLSEPVAFANLDADLYSSTRDVLVGLGRAIAPGTVLSLDDLFAFGTWRLHAFRALREWEEATGLRLEWFSAGRTCAAGVVRR